jgi:hypothetical protein
MASPEVVAALVTVAGSAVMAGGTAAATYVLKRKKGDRVVLSRLRTHSLFRLHEDVELHICCSDPIRMDLFNHIKCHVLLDPVQREIRFLLDSWTDKSFERETDNVGVCLRLYRSLDEITRVQKQRGGEVPEATPLVEGVLRPFHSTTLRSIRDLVQTHYTPQTMIALAVNVLCSALFTLVVDWSKRANMVNGHLNTLVWRGRALRNTYHGSTDTLTAHVQRWGGLVDQLTSEEGAHKADGRTLALGIFLCTAEGKVLYASPLGRRWLYGGDDGDFGGEARSSFLRDATACSGNVGSRTALVQPNLRAGDRFLAAVSAAESFTGAWPHVGITDGHSGVLSACVEPIATLNPLRCVSPDADDEAEVLCSCVLVAAAQWPVSDAEELDMHTALGFVMRASSFRFDAIVTASVRRDDKDGHIVYRSAASPGRPDLPIGALLHVCLGVHEAEMQCVVGRAETEATEGRMLHLLRYGSLTYIAQSQVYVAGLFMLSSGLIFALHTNSGGLQARRGEGEAEGELLVTLPRERRDRGILSSFGRLRRRLTRRRDSAVICHGTAPTVVRSAPQDGAPNLERDDSSSSVSASL